MSVGERETSAAKPQHDFQRMHETKWNYSSHATCTKCGLSETYAEFVKAECVPMIERSHLQSRIGGRLTHSASCWCQAEEVTDAHK